MIFEPYQLISFEDALKLLPETETIHTTVTRDGTLIGADISRDQLLAEMQSAKEIRVAPVHAQQAGHGLAIPHLKSETPTLMFIETKYNLLEGELS